MRLIDADELLWKYENWLHDLESPEDSGDRRGVECCIAELEDAPTVDAVPVVRCKDCKWYVGMVEKIMKCANDQKYRRPDDFCSYGERSVDNG